MHHYKHQLITGWLLLLTLLSTPLQAGIEPDKALNAQPSQADIESYEALAKKVVDGFSEHSTKAFNDAIDANSILDTTFKGMFIKPELEKQFRSRLKTVITSRLGNKIVEQMPPGSYARLLRVKMEGVEARALVRIDYGDYGSGYIDMHLGQSPDGKIRIIDWFDYSSGQQYSQSLRQIVATYSPTPTLLGTVFDLASNKEDNANILTHLVRLNKQQQYARMVNEFLAQNEAIRQSRLMNVLVIQAANLTQDMALYHRALSNLERFYRDDESMALLLLDFYYLEKRYDKVIDTVTKLRSSIGTEDANLMILEANALLEQGKHQPAATLAHRAIELEPKLEYGYLSLFMSQLLSKQYEKAVATAKILEQEFGYDMSPASLKSDETFSAFSRSDAYQNWRNGS